MMMNPDDQDRKEAGDEAQVASRKGPVAVLNSRK
jgi:hypothetical protein